MLLWSAISGLAHSAPHPQAPRTVRASVNASSVPADAQSERPSISDDGLIVGFATYATNLSPNDVDSERDVYAFDRATGAVELISVSSVGAKGDDDSYIGRAGASSTGRYIAFSSVAGNLVPGDFNGVNDVFLRDRQLGTTARVSIGANNLEANQPSYLGSASSDGRFVAFRCDADNIDPTDSNGAPDIYVKDMLAGTLVRASDATGGAQSTGLATNCSISSNGRFVVFQSNAQDLVPGDTDFAMDVFVHDLIALTTEIVSISWLGTHVASDCTEPVISADGRYVAFMSLAPDLVPTDINSGDIFYVDRLLGTIQIVSVNSQGIQANGDTLWPSISPEGRQVAFTSLATNLVPGNGGYDCYVHDLDSSETRIISVDGAGNPSKGVNLRPAVATLGRAVAFYGSANDLVPGPSFNYQHVYVHTTEGCPFPEVYCQPSSTSVAGCAMELWFQHAPQASSPQDFKFRTLAPAGNLAIGLVGISGTANLPLGTLGGAVCVQQPFQRLPVKSGGGDPGFCNGYYEYTLADVDAATPYVAAGNELFVQIWSRDPANADGFALSDAGRFTVCP